MSTKKFWCHYLGSDGNTPKRRSIELTSITDLMPSISNEGVNNPLWYEKHTGCMSRYYELYAQLNDNVAVKILLGSISEICVENLNKTDDQIDEYWQQDEETAQRKKRERDRDLRILRNRQDYDMYLLSDGVWIDAATIKAYEEAESPYLPVLKEMRRRNLAEREEEVRQRKEEERKLAEEEARKKAEEEVKEQERLDGEAVKFKNGGSISGCDVVDLCRRYGISIHLRTIHNLQQVIADINGKEETCQYYRTRGQRRPQLDGCYKTARELYEYLQIH